MSGRIDCVKVRVRRIEMRKIPIEGGKVIIDGIGLTEFLKFELN